MRKSKIFLIVLVILVSCSPQRRLARLLERYPLPQDTVVIVKDTTIYRDTLLFAYFPGDTVYKDTLIPFEIDLPYMELKTRSTMAFARSWVLNNRLGLELIQYDSLFQFKLDSALRNDIDSIFVEVIREVPVIIKPKPFYRNGFFILLGLILFALAVYIAARVLLRK